MTDALVQQPLARERVGIGRSFTPLTFAQV